MESVRKGKNNFLSYIWWNLVPIKHTKTNTQSYKHTVLQYIHRGNGSMGPPYETNRLEHSFNPTEISTLNAATKK